MVTGMIGPAGQDAQKLVVGAENIDNEIVLIHHPPQKVWTVLETSSRKIYATLVHAQVII